MGKTKYLIISLILIIITAAGAADPPVIVLQNEHQSLAVDFHADRTSGTSPLTVSFTDLSEGSPGEWHWDFGDGSQETVQNPVHVYTEPGTYSVSLEISGPSGADRKTRLGYIDVQSPSLPVRPVMTPLPEFLPPPPVPVEEVTGSAISPPSPAPLPQEQEADPPGPLPVESGTETDLLSRLSHPVHAAFTASQTTGTIPLTVRFTDASTGGGLGRFWDFGDGNTSDLPSPEHTFTTPGLYTVKLTVQGEHGSDTALEHQIIDVADHLQANFVVLPRTGAAPLLVGFADHSTGRITSYDWDFGDGARSNETSPVHQYTHSGVYSVSLTVSGPDGASTRNEADLITVTETIQPPAASISVDQASGTAPLTVQFTDTSTGDVTTRSWDFGDGNTDARARISHTFPSAGTYPVSLLIRGPGGESRAGLNIVVSEAPEPVPEVTVLTDISEGTAPLTISFTGSSPAEISSWSWDFGDGEYSDDQSPVHTYATPGSYPVLLTVAGESGEATATAVITVREPESSAPVAGMYANPAEGTAPLDVRFTDSSTGEITSWVWEFGDGETSSEKSPVHTYTTPGWYTAVHTVSGPGGEDSTETAIFVREAPVSRPAPVAGMHANPAEGTAPLDVRFTDSSTGEITSWVWKFGDGETSSEKSPVHTYTTPGWYTAVHTVAGPGGKDSTETAIFVREAPVSRPAPVAGMHANPAEGTAPLEVQFTDSSTGEITSWAWEFGDGERSDEADPRHTYTVPGTYPVILTVSGPGGESREKTEITVAEPASQPVASLTADVSGGQAPLTVTFTDVSDGGITRRSWDFGDGASSEEQSPVHVYSSPGEYHTVLTVSGPGGESRADVMIIVTSALVTQPPAASFTADKTEGYPPLTVTFTGTSSGEFSTAFWDLGDGSTGTDQSLEHTYTAAGTYPVILTISGPGGESRYESVITVHEPVSPEPAAAPQNRVKAGFSLPRSEGAAPLTLPFTDTSSGTITSWLWDFGDGGTSTDQNPRHTYTTPGTYPVVLIVSGPDGENRSDPSLILVTRSDARPWAACTASPQTGSSPLLVSFTDESAGKITRWNWTFDDGTTSDLQHPVHEYPDPGTYQARLEVTGPGGSDTADLTITVNPPDDEPVAAFNVSPMQGPAPLRVTFTDSSSGTITARSYNFDDGTGSSEPDAVHTFRKPGTYSVSYSVTGPGGSDETRRDIVVSDEETEREIDEETGAEPGFTADTTKGAAPLRVVFHPENIHQADGYLWDFGDGSVAYNERPVHLYEAPGVYEVSLTISGRDGVHTVTQPGLIIVTEEADPEEPAPPANQTLSTDPLHEDVTDEDLIAGEEKPAQTVPARDASGVVISAEVMNGTAPLRTTFHARVPGEVDGYVWDFGDGAFSYDPDPDHAYAIPGNYTVKLTTSGSEGIFESWLQDPIVVLPGETIPVAAFSAAPVKGYAPVQVTFTDNSVGSYDLVRWDFGDGEVSTDQNPVHTYSRPGKYTVSLKVSGSAGWSEEVKTDLITVEKRPVTPDARFKAEQRSGRAPLTVSLQDLSTGGVTGWRWDLGDGRISTEQNPQVTYTRPGSYSINLSVTGPGGSDFAIRRGYITVTSPASPASAAIYAEPKEGSAPLSVRFLDLSEGSLSGWHWTFGDGRSSDERNPTHVYQKAGTYEARLNVTGSEGGSTTAMIIRVTNEEPVPRPDLEHEADRPSSDFSISVRNGTTPLVVTFFDRSVGEITSRSWDFGDGEVSTEQDPVHIYNRPGRYPVSLTVSGPGGSSSKRIQDAVIVSGESPYHPLLYPAVPHHGIHPIQPQ